MTLSRGLRVLAYFGVLALIAVVLTAWDGIVTVRVCEKSPGGHHIYIVAPAIIVPVALRFIPARYFRGSHDAQLGLVLPAVEAVTNSLSEVSDTVLVEVVSPGSHISVRKQGHSVITDVDDTDDYVHVSVPLRAIRATARILACKAQTAGHNGSPVSDSPPTSNSSL
jgi:hypothetical protein